MLNSQKDPISYLKNQVFGKILVFHPSGESKIFQKRIKHKRNGIDRIQENKYLTSYGSTMGKYSLMVSNGNQVYKTKYNYNKKTHL